jgi:putative ABC transport system permease protein
MEYGMRFDPVSADLTVIGVILDINYQTLKKTIRPEIYRVGAVASRAATVRFSGDPSTLLASVEALWKRIAADVPFAYDFLDDCMAEEFEAEKNQAALLATFAGLAVLVACFGLVGLASFTAQVRTR